MVPTKTRFDKVGIDLLNCRLFQNFMIFLDKHACNSHINLGINNDDENDMNFLMNI